MRTAEELQNAAIVRRYLDLYNTGEVEQAVEETMVEALEWEWAATPLYPGASGQTRDGFLQGLIRGLAVERRGLSTRCLVVDGDLVVHRGDYTGSIGNLRFDSQLFQFYTLRNGAITRIEEVAYMPLDQRAPRSSRAASFTGPSIPSRARSLRAPWHLEPIPIPLLRST